MHLRGRKWREAGEDCITRSFITCIINGDQVKKDEICGACSTPGTNEKCIYFGLKTWREGPLGRPRHRWEDDNGS
jgi:hypothetical protein